MTNLAHSLDSTPIAIVERGTPTRERNEWETPVYLQALAQTGALARMARDVTLPDSTRNDALARYYHLQNMIKSYLLRVWDLPF